MAGNKDATAVNKVVYFGETLIDLTADTVTAETLAQGETAHNAAGEIITGTLAGGGLAYADELYSSDAVDITYTSTSAGTAKSITGIANLCKYPFIAVIIENVDTSASAKKFIRSATIIGNVNFAAGTASVVRYGTEQYYSSVNVLTNIASTSYGLWGYTINTSGTLTIRGRVNTNYYNTLTGTYKVRVLGIKF